MKWATLLLVSLLVVQLVAANIDEYPAQFLDEGSFNGLIVVADEGSSLDYLGANKLMSDLFSRSTVTIAADDGAAGDGAVPADWMVDNQHDFLEGGEGLNLVFDVLTEQEWAPLASGEVTNQEGTYTYRQYLYPGSSNKVRHDVADGVPDDPEEKAGAYLDFDAGNPAYEYEFLFDPPLETTIDADDSYALDDLEGVQLTLLGNDYVVSKTEHDENNSLMITLAAESVELTLREGETKTVLLEGQEYEVTVVFVSDPASGGDPEVKLSFDGETIKSLERLETYNVNDEITIWIKDVMVNARDAVVDIGIGASKIELKDADVTDGAYDDVEWEVNSQSVEDTAVLIEGIDDGLVDEGTFRLKRVRVKWTPDERHYVAPGQGLKDVVEEPNQIFGQNFDITYNGPTKDLRVEGLQFKPKGDEVYKLTFTNKLGHTLDVPLFYDDDGTFSRLGDEDYALHLEEGVNISQREYFLVTSDGHKEAVEARGNTHYFRYLGQDVDENLLEFEDVALDQKIEVYYAEGASTATLPHFGEQYALAFSDTTDDGDIQVDLDGSGAITAGDKPILVTFYEMAIDVDVSDPEYAYQRFYTYSNMKQESLIGAAMNAYLFAWGQVVETTLEAAIANFTMENPVGSTAAFQEFYEGMRFTVEDSSGEIDIANIERCLDAADPAQLSAAITTLYDGNTTINAVMDAQYGTGSRNLSDAIAYLFLDGGPVSAGSTTLYGCYPFSSTVALTFLLDMSSDTRDQQGTTGFGQKTQWLYSSSNPDDVLIFSPKDPANHQVFYRSTRIADAAVPAAEESMVASLGNVETVLDSSMPSIDQDVIVIGGPCVNDVAAMILGEESCDQGFEPGMARITLTRYGGHDVLIVAGYEGADTLFAVEALLEETGSLRGSDLVVSGTLDDLSVADYEAPIGVEPVTPPAEEEPETAPEETAPPAASGPLTLGCDATNDESGSFTYELSKLGITKQVDSNPRVIMDATDGQVLFKVSEPFEAQLGVDWLQYEVHILEGSCSGPEVARLTFRWEDGEGDKSESFSVPSEGCYCMKIGSEDLTIDDADISMVGGPLTVPFGTSSPAESLATGSVIFGASAWFPWDPRNDMNPWNNP